jgi:hypothetical protein
VKRRRFARRLLEATTIAVAAAGLAAVGLGQNAFAGFQDRATDSFFPSAKTDPAVVVVGMDERSFDDDRIGPPPWPRSVHAQIARQLTAAGAKVIVWDVVFFSSSQNTGGAAIGLGRRRHDHPGRRREAAREADRQRPLAPRPGIPAHRAPRRRVDGRRAREGRHRRQ